MSLVLHCLTYVWSDVRQYNKMIAWLILGITRDPIVPPKLP